MPTWLKYIKVALISIVIIFALLIAFNWQTVNRLYSVITLFDKALIVNNFSQMKTVFFNKRIEQQGTPYVFKSNLHPLPASFIYKNQSTNTQACLTRRATTALLVLKDDQISYEQYFLGTHSDDKRISWSMAKSVVATLLGMAHDEGLFDLEKPVTDYLPQLKETGYDGVRIKDILQMSSGVGFNEEDQNKPNSFGLKLISSLIEQLDGSFSMQNNNGTHSIIDLEI